MIDPVTAREGAALLSSAIAELLEDAASEAALVQSEAGFLERALRLRETGDDLLQLAGAMAVFARRFEGAAA